MGSCVTSIDDFIYVFVLISTKPLLEIILYTCNFCAIVMGLMVRDNGELYTDNVRNKRSSFFPIESQIQDLNVLHIENKRDVPVGINSLILSFQHQYLIQNPV
jgi:hypothetical protein